MKEFATIRGNPYMDCEVVMPKPNPVKAFFKSIGDAYREFTEFERQLKRWRKNEKSFYEAVAKFQKAYSGLGFTIEETKKINVFRKLLLEKLNNKDMKKECRINEINEAIKRLKKEKKKLKCDGSVKIPEFSVKDDNGCVILEDRRGGDHCGRAVWLSERYNWEIVKDGDNWGRTLIPTEK